MKIKKINVHLSEEQVAERVRELGAQISADYGDEPVCLICILKGSVFFTCELAKRISSPVELEFMSVSSYGSGTTSSGVVRIVNDLGTSIEGKNVLVIEDIIDTGRTLKYLMENLKTRNPKSLKLCTLLDKPDRRVVDVAVDYVGFVIPDEFVVGYGLDYDQKYRNLPYIGFAEKQIEYKKKQLQRVWNLSDTDSCCNRNLVLDGWQHECEHVQQSRI